MDEWLVVTVIVTLIGLVTAIATPLVRLNTTLAKLNTTVSIVEKNLEALIEKNTRTHDRIWDELHEQEYALSNHETRISFIEKQQS